MNKNRKRSLLNEDAEIVSKDTNDELLPPESLGNQTPKHPRAGKSHTQSKKIMPTDTVSTDVQTRGKDVAAHKMLNQKQRTEVFKSIKGMSLDIMIQPVEEKLCDLSEDILKHIFADWSHEKLLLTSLIEQYHSTFISLYIKA